ncbi:MAG: hypothetical protein ABWZ82_07500 [Candidatus Limnocylindrales bacterium]
MTKGRGLAVATVGWAVIGLLVGHVAAYDLVFPDAHVHAAELAGSGHAWLGMLQPALVLALGFVAVGGWLAARTSGPRDVRFHRLLLIQVAAFVAVELGERTLAGYSPLDLWHALADHGLWLILVVGIAAQVITAWLGSAASRGLAGASASLRAARPRPSRRAPLIAIRLRSTAVGRLSRPCQSRAPPPRIAITVSV